MHHYIVRTKLELSEVVRRLFSLTQSIRRYTVRLLHRVLTLVGWLGLSSQPWWGTCQHELKGDMAGAAMRSDIVRIDRVIRIFISDSWMVGDLVTDSRNENMILTFGRSLCLRVIRTLWCRDLKSRSCDNPLSESEL